MESALKHDMSNSSRFVTAWFAGLLLLTGTTIPASAQIEDCKGAIRYLRTPAKEYGVPEKKSGAPTARALPKFDDLVARSDTNKDGKIARDEFRGPPALFDRLDRNKDGAITREKHDGARPPGQ